METPSSARRITRSQAMAAAASNTNNNIPISRKFEESEKGTVPKSRQRSGKQQGALIDITNDSPIVGLAMGSLETPSSAFSKKRTVLGKNNNSSEITTPGSGEALLRGQVKTLLQKVEEEAVISKISSLDYKPRFPFCHSPMNVLAPTPANTPQVSDFSANNAALPSPMAVIVEQNKNVSQVLDERKNEEESDQVLVTRSLLLDFSEKSDSSDCVSELTYQGCENKTTRDRDDDDDSSVWSVQVNASTRDEEEEDEEQDGDVEGSLLVDQLCEGMSKISVNGQYFCGKHTRFVYDSDDELVGEEEEDDDDDDDERDESWSSSSSPYST